MIPLPILPRRGALLLALALLIFGCQPDKVDPTDLDIPSRAEEYPNDVALAWNELLLDIERTSSGYRPPVSARAFAYVGVAAYEAARPGIPGKASLETVFPELDLPHVQAGVEYHWGAAVNEAYSTLLHRFFPNPDPDIEAAMSTLEYRFKNQFARELAGFGDVYDRSKSFGRQVADAVYAWSTTDVVGHNAFQRNHDPSYLPNPTNEPGVWVPTPPMHTPALLPYWGEVRPFATAQDDILALPPPAYGEEPGNQWYDEALEVHNVTTSLTSDQRWIAEFWSDDTPVMTFTPAARWIAISNQVVRDKQPDLAKALRHYAQLSMALADAGIGCWRSKFHYNVERPITYIRREIDGNWDEPTWILTPPFPAYPSGHSTFGAAAAEILTANFGDNYAMIDRCHEGRTEFDGRPRSFNSFQQMAEENAVSRIYLGVHYRMDAVEGLRHGQELGRNVLDLPW